MKTNKKIICYLPKIDKKVLPLLPWTQMEKASNKNDLINRVKNENFSWLISSIGEKNYYYNFSVLEATRSLPTRKILYAEKEYTPTLKKIVEGFNAFIINPWELPTINGMLNSPAPLKKEGKILVYFRTYYEQLLIFNEKQHKKIEKLYPVKINNYSQDELDHVLSANTFKVIIDTSTASYPWTLNTTTSMIIEKFRNFNFLEIPILVCLKNQFTLKRDILKNINYYSQLSKV